MRLLTAGFGYESMLRMINTALITKSEDESLATLDIVDINLFTGDVRLHKAGAGASLLYSKDHAHRCLVVAAGDPAGTFLCRNR